MHVLVGHAYTNRVNVIAYNLTSLFQELCLLYTVCTSQIFVPKLFINGNLLILKLCVAIM